MGASAGDIEREIKETRDRMDDNLARLEVRASSRARRYGGLIALVSGAALVAGAGYLLYRRRHKPTLRDRLDSLSLKNLRSLAAELSVTLKERLPSVTIRVNEKTDQEPGTAQAILREVAPVLVSTAAPTLLDRAIRYMGRTAE